MICDKNFVHELNVQNLLSKTDNKLLYNSTEPIKNTLMYIKNVINLLPNYLKSESPNKFEASYSFGIQ